MNTVDPRVQRWLDNKNTLTRTFLAAVKVQAARIAACEAMDKDMAAIIPALQHYNKAYGIGDAHYDQAKTAWHDFLRKLDPKENAILAKKHRRCANLFSEAHNFWENEPRFLTFALPDNSLDFIGFTLSVEPEGNSDLPAKTLFTVGDEPRSSAARIELSQQFVPPPAEVLQGLSMSARMDMLRAAAIANENKLVMNFAEDWNDSGVILRNMKLQPNAKYMAFYFPGYGVRQRTVETAMQNSRPRLGNIEIGRF